ncbi:N-acetylmuramoyl-L-alanine amidase [Indibacter alkaliphilus LW1]|uniref:N-acetylmuramoyl-L-alanine amidase n=1 Tax=Indibacter alkaliphilus (strain CCUG 57479 / KCTC 22604 / LW1) TaxID=1189612 RepID=S2D8A6_INDAL|nr:N-acetylmuramoyl-L-alanine amidase [Indibacter alkaliphilus]EOZ95134.1 N-acetylmuramoyl-L-alanine amidase [Indibacter alkaliphilus LW1]
MKRFKVKNILIIPILTFSFLLAGYSTAGPKETRTERVKRVVIDAGHGGKDPGALGSSSKEKDIALTVALQVGKYVEELLPGVEVIYTRKTDTFLELKERANIANRNKADLFISIHCNAAGNRSAYGTETFVMGTKNFEANFDIVKRENAVILLEDNYEENYEGFDPNSPESYMMFNLTQKAYLSNSISLAAKVEDDFRTRVNRHSRGVKQAPLYVLWTTYMPSVLVELGFISNVNEERFLKSQQGQTYLASAIFRAIKAYKEELDEM